MWLTYNFFIWFSYVELALIIINLVIAKVQERVYKNFKILTTFIFNIMFDADGTV